MSWNYKYLLFLIFFICPIHLLGQTPTPIPGIIATDEGLVGQWIVPNGQGGGFHLIIANDWFVALPSRSVLSFNDSWLNRIRIEFTKKVPDPFYLNKGDFDEISIRGSIFFTIGFG